MAWLSVVVVVPVTLTAFGGGVIGCWVGADRPIGR
jgi:hypothetical protein